MGTQPQNYKRRYSRRTIRKGEAAAQRLRIVMEIAKAEPHRLKIEDVSELIGRSPSCIRNWMRGTSIPLGKSVERIDEFCSLLQDKGKVVPIVKVAKEVREEAKARPTSPLTILSQLQHLEGETSKSFLKGFLTGVVAGWILVIGSISVVVLYF